MAFTVTPTRGANPYILNADVDNFSVINGVHYRATVSSTRATGSCPALGVSSAMNANAVAQLVSGVPVDTGASTVATGDCRTWTLTIIKVSDNSIIDQSSVSVSNL